MERTWYIGKCSSGIEDIVLERLPFDEVYLPIRIHRNYNRRNRVWRVEQCAMFPGYFFASLSEPHRLLGRRPKGYFGLLRNNDKSYATLSSSEIMAVREVEESGIANIDLPTAHPFKPGDTVTLKKGVVEGFHAVVKALRADSKLELDGLSFMQRSARVIVHAKDVSALAA